MRLQWLLAGVPHLRTFGRCVENVRKVLTFGRWERCRRRGNAATVASRSGASSAHLRKVSRKCRETAHLRKVEQMSECRKDEGVEECGGRGVGQAYCRRAGGMRPRVMAFMTMSAALVAPSLRMMWLRWDSTVFSVM